MLTFWKKSAKEEGISCVIRCKNEVEWVRLCILSIVEFADEIIYVDNESDDGSLAAVHQLREDWGIEKMKIFRYPRLDGERFTIDKLTNYAFEQATKTWVFRWDADFIARTQQLYSIIALKELWARNRRDVDLFNLCGTNLFGDHVHYLDSPPYDYDFCYEAYLWRNKGYRYVQGPHYEKLVFDRQPRVLSIGPRASEGDRRVFFFHLQALKPDETIAWRKTRSLWWEYCLTTGSTKLSYEEWLADFWGTDCRDEQTRRCMQEFLKQVKRHDKIGCEWGDYPLLMKPYLEDPKYEIVYQDGSPHHRITHEDREVPVPLPQIT
jgi:glycosyltransferase involved in cell wall biosynthesis